MAAKFVVLNFYGCGFAGAPQLSVEVRWWDADKLLATNRFESTPDDESGLGEWQATFDMDEFKKLHEKFRKNTKSGLFGTSSWREVIDPIMQTIDLALVGGLGVDVDEVVVEIFEHESGY